MGDHVRVSYEGMEELARMAKEQHVNLSEAAGIVSCGILEDSGAFGGFMSIFRGSYVEALQDANSGMDKALTGAEKLAANINACLSDYQDGDAKVARDHNRLHETLVRGPGTTYTPPSGDGLVDLPGAATKAGDAYDAARKTVGQEGGTPATEPLRAADEFTKFVNSADGWGAAHEDLEKDKQFEENNP